MLRLIRSASLTGYADLARRLGLDPMHMLREAGLDRSCLIDPDIRIATSGVVRLLEASAAAAGVEDFGLRLAQTRRLSNLGPIGLAAREEPTARRALETLSRYLRLHNESLFASIEDSAGLSIISTAIVSGVAAGARQSAELAVGALYRILRELLGDRWEARRVCFTHSAPASLVSHVRYLGRFVEFGREFNGVVCLSAELDAQRPSADPEMARNARNYLHSLHTQPLDSAADKVRQLVHGLLPKGQCAADRVAKHLGIDRRTLHRHLAREGETFSALVESVRAELVSRYVPNPDHRLADVTTMLGFTSQSAFSRWFRAKFGCTVAQWREAARIRGAATSSRY